MIRMTSGSDVYCQRRLWRPAIENTIAEVSDRDGGIRSHRIEMLLPGNEIIADQYGDDGGERDPTEIDRHRQMMMTHYPPSTRLAAQNQAPGYYKRTIDSRQSPIAKQPAI